MFGRYVGFLAHRGRVFFPCRLCFWAVAVLNVDGVEVEDGDDDDDVDGR